MNIAPHGSSIAVQSNPARRAQRRLLHMLILLCAFGGLPLRAEATPQAALVRAPLLTTLVISEFRVRGPNGANDEFVEIYNNSNTAHTVSGANASAGYAVAASNGVTRFIIPNGTIIPGRGHYLGVNSVGYSLASYPAGNGTTATGDATYTTDIPDNAGIALFATASAANFTLANRIDAIGSTSEANTTYKEGTGYPALTPFSIDYSFYRKMSGVAAVDADNNAADFVFVDTNGTSAGAGQRLGAPGPENLSSPIGAVLPSVVGTSGIAIALLDPTATEDAEPNYVRNNTSDPAQNSSFGTISLRRTITNNSGVSITRLRLRLTDLTTFPSPSGIADLRPRTSTAVVVAVPNLGNVTVQGTTLEQPPSQPNGGGFNSSLSVGTITLATPLAPGAKVHIQLLFGVQQTGCVKLAFDLPLAYDTCSGITTTTAKLTCSSFTATGTASFSTGYAAMRVWIEAGAVPLIDSYVDQSVPVAYASIGANHTYAISANFPAQPAGTVLRGRIYRAPLNQFGSWDTGAYQDFMVSCSAAKVYIPLFVR